MRKDGLSSDPSGTECGIKCIGLHLLIATLLMLGWRKYGSCTKLF